MFGSEDITGTRFTSANKQSYLSLFITICIYITTHTQSETSIFLTKGLFLRSCCGKIIKSCVFANQYYTGENNSAEEICSSSDKGSSYL